MDTLTIDAPAVAPEKKHRITTWRLEHEFDPRAQRLRARVTDEATREFANAGERDAAFAEAIANGMPAYTEDWVDNALAIAPGWRVGLVNTPQRIRAYL